jgi:hypothetical protein
MPRSCADTRWVRAPGAPGNRSHPPRQADRSSTAIPGVVTSKESPLAGDAGAPPRGEHRGMVIALLAVLGVDLIVIVASSVSCSRAGAGSAASPARSRAPSGSWTARCRGWGPKWKRGYSRWVRDVLVWTKAPLMFQNELVALDGLAGEVRAAEPGDVKRVGSDPMILPLAADGGARVEVAAAADDVGGRSGRWRPLLDRDIGPGRAARPPNRDGAPQPGRPVAEHSGPKGDGDPARPAAAGR